MFFTPRKNKTAEPSATAENPLSLPRAIVEGLRYFHEDARSGLDIPAGAERIANAVLGDKVAPGIFVSRLGKVAKFHIFDTPVNSTIMDLENAQSAFIKCINQFQKIEGVTPSKSALRAMVILLRNLPGVSERDSKSLGKLRKIAVGVDLNRPQNPNWKEETTMTIGDTSVHLTLGLNRNSFTTQQLTKMLGSDISADQRGHKYSYHLEMAMSAPIKTEALRKAEYMLKRWPAIGLTVTPALAVEWLGLRFLPPNLIPAFTENAFIQSLTHTAIQVSVSLIISVSAYHLVVEKLKRSRHT